MSSVTASDPESGESGLLINSLGWEVTPPSARTSRLSQPRIPQLRWVNDCLHAGDRKKPQNSLAGPAESVLGTFASALPAAIAAGPRAAWVTNVAEGSVLRIALDDGATARVNVGAGPVALGFDSVWLGTNNSVNEVVKTIRIGYKPNCVAAHDGHSRGRRAAAAVLSVDGQA